MRQQRIAPAVTPSAWRSALRLATVSLVAVSVTAACAASGSQNSVMKESVSARPASAAQDVTLLFFADLHAQLEEHPELFWSDEGDRIETAGGFARVAQAIRDERAAKPDGTVIAIDGGDTIQGSAAAALTEGAAVIPLLQQMGFDIAIPGNWEVVYGPDVMTERLSELPYPTIAANVFYENTGERVFAPTWTTTVGEVTVGFVGFTDPDVPFRQPPTYSVGLRYDDSSELNALAATLRDTEGADVVILVSHIGLSKAIELTEHLKGFDLHLSADTHERTYEPFDVNGIWVVEPGAFGSFMGRLELTVADGAIVDKSWELVELTASSYGEAPDVRATLDTVLAPMREELDKEIGSLSETLARYDVVETTLDNLLADALRETTGTDIALSNGFRFGTPLLPGVLRESNLYDFYPIVTNLKTGEVRGEQLRDFWERELENVFAADASKRFGGWVPRPSGMTMTFRAHAPFGQRIDTILVNGEPLENDRMYTITACEREGDADHMVCRIPHVTNTRVHEIDAHEAVRRYLRAHTDLTAPARDRIQALDLPDVVRSQTMLPNTEEHE